MSTQDDTADLSALSAAPATTPSLSTTPTAADVDYGPTQAALEDLQMQDSVVAQVLAVLDDAGRSVADGAPDWVDPGVFGSSRTAERMARHTLRAQDRVHRALDLGRAALAQHHVAMTTFRDEVRRVEAETEDQLAAVRARLSEVTRVRGASS